MSDFITKNNILFGIIFVLISGYFFFKSAIMLFKEFSRKDWMSYSFTIGILVGWFAIFLASIGFLIGNNSF